MTEREPFKENEVFCAYCGPGWKAAWEVITEDGDVSVCEDHHFVLRQVISKGLERKIGDSEWKEIIDVDYLDEHFLEDIGDWKDLINYDDL